MRRAFFLSAVMLLCLSGVVSAQVTHQKKENFEGVRISNVELKHVDGMMHITMSMEFGSKNIHTDYATIYTPMLYNGDANIELQSVGVFGHNHYYSTLRREHHHITAIPDEWCLRRRDLPARVNYVAEVEYEPWMNGAALVVVEQYYGCNDELLALGEVVIDEYTEPMIVSTYIFVLPEEVVSGVHHASSSAQVDFPVNKAVIDPNFNGNSREIAILDKSLDSLSADKNVVVTRIVVRGSTSPEGGHAFNDELAHARANALVAHISQHYNIPSGVLATYYDTDHWADVRTWVAQSDIANRQEILNLIDSHSTSANLNAMIMERYPEQYQLLLDEYYPSLRNASYDVEYDVTEYEDIDRIVAVAVTAPMSLTADELTMAASKVDQSTPEFDNIIMAIVAKTPDSASANLNAANVMMRRGELQRAARHLAKAGTSAEADYARALYALHMGNYDEAKHLLKRVESKIGCAAKILDKIEQAGY